MTTEIDRRMLLQSSSRGECDYQGPNSSRLWRTWLERQGRCHSAKCVSKEYPSEVTDAVHGAGLGKRAPAPASNGTPNQKHDDGPNGRANQTSALTRVIPAKSLS